MQSVDIRAPYEADIVPLSSAALCENCQMITASRDGRCRACGSGSVLMLAGLLNREASDRKTGRSDGTNLSAVDIPVGARVRIRGKHLRRGQEGVIAGYREIDHFSSMGLCPVVRLDSGRECFVLHRKQLERLR